MHGHCASFELHCASFELDRFEKKKNKTKQKQIKNQTNKKMGTPCFFVLHAQGSNHSSPKVPLIISSRGSIGNRCWTVPARLGWVLGMYLSGFRIVQTIYVVQKKIETDAFVLRWYGCTCFDQLRLNPNWPLSEVISKSHWYLSYVHLLAVFKIRFVCFESSGTYMCHLCLLTLD